VPWRSTLLLFVLVGLAWAGWLVLQRMPGWAEGLLASGPHPTLVRGLGRLAALLPFPLAEGLVVVLGLWLVRLPFLWRREPWLTLLLRPLRLGAGLALLFILLWGVQYARPALEARLLLPPSGPAAQEEIQALAEALVERTNDLYRRVHGSEDVGEPTPAPTAQEIRGPIAESLERSWEWVVHRWELPPEMALPRPAPRPMLLTPVIRWTGVAGLYVPWTGEALILSDLVGAGAPLTIAHETAHQRGVAREADANALAYLLALESEWTELRYAAALFLQRQALSALAGTDPEATLRLVESRVPGVQRDVEALRLRALEVAGPTERLARRANDAMLRTHGFSEGIQNYAGSLWVVLALARREGLEALLPPVQAPRSLDP
jgi:hypothetical protein